jgi:predicted nuclease with TOPRIM domain
MAKTKNKNKSEVEYLRGEVKRLKSQLSSLNRRNRNLEKKAHFYENIVDEATEDVDIKNSCPECGKGTLHYYDMVHIKLEICDICDFKRKLK